MATSRGGPPPLSATPSAQHTPGLLADLPSISALFLIDFDVKAGYTIIWKQAVPGLELEGVVEYKSLPSGLHTVPDDLIYFVHEAGHAGLSAFVNAPTDEEESRHARMIAVGVLLPLSYGRLGRAWRHAEGLKAMAAKLAADRKATSALEEYWEKCGTRDSSRQPQPIRDSPLASPAMSFAKRPGAAGEPARNRSASEGAALIAPGHRLSPFHPAWSLNNLLDTFGPLIFPIHRAALLRKRILISTHAPVHEVCNFVYNISILANIPLSVFDLLDPSSPSQRIRPLFTIGVHDIPFLMADNASSASKRPDPTPEQHTSPLGDAKSGWIACTTDSILAMKNDLWDVLITMPPAYSADAKEKVWPAVESPKGVPMKATQRDLRRFRTLKAGLRRLAATTSSAITDDEDQQNNAASSINNETQRPSAPSHRQSRMSMSSMKTSNFLSDGEDSTVMADAAEKIVEPMTWAALAYSGFMWWASAGEQRQSDEVEETAHDNSLLADLFPAPTPAANSGQQRRTSGSFNVTGMSGGAMTDSITSLTARRTTTVDGLLLSAPGSDGVEEDRARTELGIITYFHRLTAGVLGTLAEIVAVYEEDEYTDADVSGPTSEDGEETERLVISGDAREAEDSRGVVRIDSEALAAMGLDVWSKADAEFVKEAVFKYFNRDARVESKGVEVCGLRVC